MYSIDEIERMLEDDRDMPDFVYATIIRQLLAERSQIRKQAFEEAAEMAIKITQSDDCLTDPCSGPCPDCVSEIFRREAEEGK